MANITAADVNKLRQQTGAGMMDCKKALVEAEGDFEKAIALENEVRQKDQHVYFHPLAIPLEKAVEQSELQTDMFDGCDSGYCFT